MSLCNNRKKIGMRMVISRVYSIINEEVNDASLCSHR